MRMYDIYVQMYLYFIVRRTINIPSISTEIMLYIYVVSNRILPHHLKKLMAWREIFHESHQSSISWNQDYQYCYINTFIWFYEWPTSPSWMNGCINIESGIFSNWELVLYRRWKGKTVKVSHIKNIYINMLSQLLFFDPTYNIYIYIIFVKYFVINFLFLHGKVFTVVKFKYL